MIHVDDLDVGTWVAISGITFEPPTDHFGNQARFQCDGHPWQVKAISLPFVSLSDGKKKGVILDTRNFVLVRLQPQYVRRVLRDEYAAFEPTTTRRKRRKKLD